MIDDVDHPRMKKAEVGLKAILANFMRKPLSYQIIERIMSHVRDHRRRWRGQGVDFPPLVPLINPYAGTIELVREDLDRKDIITTIKNFIIKNPNLSPQDIAQSVKIAWPNIKSGFILDSSEEFKEKVKNSIENNENSPNNKPDTTDNDLVELAIKNDPTLSQHYKES